MLRKFDKANCITCQSTLLVTSMFKANPTSDFHLSVQIKNLSLRWNKIGNSGAKALATCLWNIDELDLMDCDITECEELCNAIQSLERPVSFNLVSRHTVLKFVWYSAGVKICSWLCRYFFYCFVLLELLLLRPLMMLRPPQDIFFTAASSWS